MSHLHLLPPGLSVLVVDDDPKFRAFVDAGLRDCGVECVTAANAQEAVRALRGMASDPPDVVLLDIMMPEVDGWSLLQKIKTIHRSLPILFVTAREAVEERVRGLQMGAEDYIIKPFAFAELVARIGVVARRRDAAILRRGNLSLDGVDRIVRVDGRTVEFTPKEFDLLRALLQAGSEHRSRAQLLAEVWHVDRDPGTNVVEVHVTRLRRKLASANGPNVRNTRGQGYSLEDRR